MKYIQLLVSFLLINYFQYNWATFEFTNIKCNAVDKNFTFDYCYLKAVNRTYKYISFKLYSLYIVDNVNVNIAIMKRLNGWKPFLYNVTFDGCEYLRKRKTNPVVDFLASLAIGYTNMNHTCPYNHSVILDKLPISHLSNALSNVLPMPSGEYAFMARYYSSGLLRVTLNAYGKIY